VLGEFIVTATRTPVRSSALGAVSTSSQAMTWPGSRSRTPKKPWAARRHAAVRERCDRRAASLFMRGANSDQTLFLVDGMRMNDPNTDYSYSWVVQRRRLRTPSRSRAARKARFTAAKPSEGWWRCERLRVKGPRRATGSKAVRLERFQSSVNTQGTGNGWAYNAFIESGGPKTSARQRFLRDDLCRAPRPQLSPQITVGATARGFFGTYGSPGDRFTNDPDNREREQNQLATCLRNTPSRHYVGPHHPGGQDRRFVSVNPTPGEPTETTVVLNRRGNSIGRTRSC